MANRLCPGSLDWPTFWALTDEQLGALQTELQPHIDAATRKR